MKITYDKEADALYIKLSEKKILKSDEIEENIIVDLDNENKIVGIEVLYFVQKHKQDFFPVFKQVEQSVWKLEELITT
jgi:uncharacterized protein YuzE